MHMLKKDLATLLYKKLEKTCNIQYQHTLFNNIKTKTKIAIINSWLQQSMTGKGKAGSRNGIGNTALQ
jgi:hypothetical protein